jgi:hypothetical protein
MDWSCKNQASAMSCSAMLSLVKKEYEKQVMSLSYQIIHPNCEALSLMPDHSKQYMRGAISRNICFTHDPVLKAGPYFSQIGDVHNSSFDKWTRKKEIVKKPYEIPKDFYDLDSVYTTCYHTVKNNCGIHPSICPNPIR